LDWRRIFKLLEEIPHVGRHLLQFPLFGTLLNTITLAGGHLVKVFLFGTRLTLDIKTLAVAQTYAA
jgi:hypothetical protein